MNEIIIAILLIIFIGICSIFSIYEFCIKMQNFFRKKEFKPNRIVIIYN